MRFPSSLVDSARPHNKRVPVIRVHQDILRAGALSVQVIADRRALCVEESLRSLRIRGLYQGKYPQVLDDPRVYDLPHSVDNSTQSSCPMYRRNAGLSIRRATIADLYVDLGVDVGDTSTSWKYSPGWAVENYGLRSIVLPFSTDSSRPCGRIPAPVKAIGSHLHHR